MSLQKMKDILRHKGYKLFTRPYELNIVGLRSKSVFPNRFDDEIHVFYRTSNLKWQYHIFKATTDPGTFWLRQPMQPQGTAILAEGQHLNCYELGLHRGQYLALVQHKPVTIIRDYNRDAVLDFNNGSTIKGYFGINIHRAQVKGSTKSVDKYSAGCQVFENAKDFELFIGLCQKHKQLYGNQFTYTLIDFRAVRRQNLRYAMAGVGVLGLAGSIYLAVLHQDKLKTAVQEAGHFFSGLFLTKTKYENKSQTNPSPAPSG
jgi:hypothetical protein